MFCYDGYGADKENWKMVKCFSGTCVKLKFPSNEHRYCDITGNHATECTYDNPNVMSVSTVKRGPNIKNNINKGCYLSILENKKYWKY